MTAHPDVSVDELRGVIVEGLQRAVDGLAAAYAAPLRRQLRAEGDVYDAAVLCLGLGRIGGAETKTLPCALTLGLLEEMGRIFLGLEDGSAIIDAWGMPRTLNAADGLYALGRHILLTHEALDTESRLAALSVYDGASRDFSEALQAWAPEGAAGLQKAAQSLCPAAASFAALCCGIGAETRDRLVALASAPHDDASGSIESIFVKASGLLLRGA
jgi:hypothetical protein